MNNQPLISIIVPCYNVEQYLPKCIDSILNQTYKNLEVWLVDDGSPDNCGEICDEYAKRDVRIHVIHKENGGLADARNVALDVMTGEYVVCVDSDDYVADDYVETLFNLIQVNESQMSITLPNPYYEGSSPQPASHIKKTLKIMSPNDALAYMFYQKEFDTSAWAKMYSKYLFSDGIRYPKDWLFEDLPTTYRLIQKCKKIAFSNYNSYYYLMRRSSIEGSSFKVQKYESCVSIVKQLEKDMPCMELNVQLALKCRIVSLAFHVLLDIPQNAIYYKNNLWQVIKKYRFDVLCDRQARRKTRLACLLSLVGLRFIIIFSNCGKSRK